MANFFAARTLPILWVGTLLGFAYTTFDWVERIEVALAFADSGDIWYELSTLLFTFPVILPSVLGFYLLIKRRLRHDALTGVYYAVYVVLLILALVFRLTISDPLGYGLSMILLVFPACGVLTLLILRRLSKGKEVRS